MAAPAEGSGAAGAAHAHDGHEQSRAEEDVAAAAHGDDLCRLVIREEEGDDGHVDVVLIVQLCVTPRSSAHQLEHPLASLVLAVSKELEPTHDDAVAGGGQEAKLEPEQFDALALWVDGVRRRRDPAAGKRQRMLGHRAVVLAIDRRPRVQHQEDVAALSALQGEERLLDWAVLAPPAAQVALEEHAHPLRVDVSGILEAVQHNAFVIFSLDQQRQHEQACVQRRQRRGPFGPQTHNT